MAQTVQVALRAGGETEGMIFGIRGSRGTDPERERKEPLAWAWDKPWNLNPARGSPGASGTGGVLCTLWVVYGRMLAWVQPSSTYPDGQLAPDVLLLLLLHGSLVTAQGQRGVGRASEPLQGNTDTSGHPRAAPQPPPSPILGRQGGWG